MADGKVIVFEGVDGSGKSTIAQFVHKHIGEDKSVLARNPGSTLLGQELRNLIKHRKDIEIDKFTEQLLFMADHSAFINGVMIPTIKAGKHVICDRHDLIGNIAYGYAGGLSKTKTYNMRRLFWGAPLIDLLFIFHCSRESSEARAKNRNKQCKVEARGNVYLDGARRVYEATAGDAPKDAEAMVEEILFMARTTVHVDANKSLDEVKEDVLHHLVEMGITSL